MTDKSLETKHQSTNSLPDMTSLDDCSDGDEDDGDEDDDILLKKPEHVSQLVYRKACVMFKVTPSSYFYRHLTDVEVPLQNHVIGALGAKALATALVTNNTVKRLNVERTGIGTEGLHYILEMLEENLTINDIDLSGNELKTEGIVHLCNFLKFNDRIQVLDISYNDLRDDDSFYIQEMLEENIGLREIHIRGNNFGDLAGRNIGTALDNNITLVSLDLAWNHLRQRGAMDFCCGLQENTRLQVLNLSWNGFGLEGCHELGKMLRVNRTLTDLDLSSNRINLDAFKLILRGMVNNKSIQTLKIGINPITTDGAIAILRAVADDSCRSLRILDLSDVSVDSHFVNLLRQIQARRPLLVNHGIELRHDELRKGVVPVVLDTDDPVTILFEFMKTRNLRLIDLLHNLDKDNSDTLSREELRKGLEEIDIPLSQRSLDILMHRLDMNNDGEIDYHELLVRYKEHVRRLAKLKKEADKDLQHYKNFDRLEQLREAVRLRLTLSSASSSTSSQT